MTNFLLFALMVAYIQFSSLSTGTMRKTATAAHVYDNGTKNDTENDDDFHVVAVTANPADCTRASKFYLGVWVDCLQQKRKKTAVAPFSENDERNNEESSIEPIGVRLTVQEKFLFFNLRRTFVERANGPATATGKTQRRKMAPFGMFVRRKFSGSITVRAEFDCESSAADEPTHICHSVVQHELAGFGDCMWKGYFLYITQLAADSSTGKCGNATVFSRINSLGNEVVLGSEPWTTQILQKHY